MSSVEEMLRRVHEAAIKHLMSLLRPEELIDANVSLSFESGALNVEVEVHLHEASLKRPNEIARQVTQYVIDLFDSMWRGALERGTPNKDDKRGWQDSHN